MAEKGEKKVGREDGEKGYALTERRYGERYRAIPLPTGGDSVTAHASVKNGVLTSKLPQTPEAQAKVRRIEVKNG